MDSLYGMKFISDASCFETQRARTFVPRSKKRRIQKKSWKRYGTDVHIPTAYQYRDTIIAHPSIIDDLRRRTA